MNRSSELIGDVRLHFGWDYVQIIHIIMAQRIIHIIMVQRIIKERQDSSIRAILYQGIEVLYILIVRISIRILVLVLSNFKRTLVPCKNLSPFSGENFQKIEVKFCGRRFSDFQPVFSLGGGYQNHLP